MISYYTIFFGGYSREVGLISACARSFLKYSGGETLHVVDMSEAVAAHLSQESRIAITRPGIDTVKETIYLAGFERNIDLSGLHSLVAKNQERIRHVPEDTVLSHSHAINRILETHCQTDWCVIMDSDIRFRNRKYFADLERIIDDRPQLAAIGEISDRPFVANSTNYNRSMNKGNRLMRMHPMLIAVNRNSFLEHNMQFKLMDVVIHNETNLFGDCGASFFYQCAMHGLEMYHLETPRYIKHEGRGSWGGARVRHVK